MRSVEVQTMYYYVGVKTQRAWRKQHFFASPRFECLLFYLYFTKIANSFWCEKPVPSEIRVRALHFRASKRNVFFAFCAGKMDWFVSYFAGFLRKTNQTSQQLFRFLMNFEIFKHQRIMFLCDKNERPKILVLKQKALIF